MKLLLEVEIDKIDELKEAIRVDHGMDHTPSLDEVKLCLEDGVASHLEDLYENLCLSREDA
jgi:hypothetical protein